MIDVNIPEIAFALDAVRQASRLIREVQRQMVAPALHKEDLSPVTVADFASQALVGRLMERAFPNDPLVAEEDSTALRAPEAPGALIVEEAEGRITDLDGRRLDFTAGRTLARNRGVLASNGHRHEAALYAVAALKA